VRLLRHAVPEEARYTVQVERSEFTGGPIRRTNLTMVLGLRILPYADNWQISLRAEAVELLKPDLTAFDKIALLVNRLYARLELEAAPTGELLRLLNHEEVGQRWPEIEQELRQKYPEPSDVLAALLHDVPQQLAYPDGLWDSLSYTYLYAALLGDFYQ